MLIFYWHLEMIFDACRRRTAGQRRERCKLALYYLSVRSARMSIDVENSVCPHVTVLTGIFRLACWALKLKAFRDHGG